MKALKAREIVDQRKSYMPWTPKETLRKNVEHETVEDFISRGGKIKKIGRKRFDPILRSRKCCSNTFELIL